MLCIQRSDMDAGAVQGTSERGVCDALHRIRGRRDSRLAPLWRDPFGAEIDRPIYRRRLSRR